MNKRHPPFVASLTLTFFCGIFLLCHDSGLQGGLVFIPQREAVTSQNTDIDDLLAVQKVLNAQKQT